MKMNVSISKADKDIAKGDYYLINVGTPKKPLVYVAEVLKVAGSKVTFRYNGTEARGKKIELGKGTSKILEKTRRKKSHKPLSPVQTEKLLAKLVKGPDAKEESAAPKKTRAASKKKPVVEVPEATGLPVVMPRTVKAEKVDINTLNLIKAKRKRSQAFHTGKEFTIDEPATTYVKYQSMPYDKWLSLIKGINTKAQLTTRKARGPHGVVTHASIDKNVLGTYVHTKGVGTVTPMVRSKYTPEGVYKDSRIVKYKVALDKNADSDKGPTDRVENVPKVLTFSDILLSVQKAIKEAKLGNSKVERSNIILPARTKTRPDDILNMFKKLGWTVVSEGSTELGTFSKVVKGDVKAVFNHGRYIKDKYVWDKTIRFEQV